MNPRLQTAEDAVALGLALAITAPTERKSDRAMKLVASFAAGLDNAAIERAKQRALDYVPSLLDEMEHTVIAPIGRASPNAASSTPIAPDSARGLRNVKLPRNVPRGNVIPFRAPSSLNPFG